MRGNPEKRMHRLPLNALQAVLIRERLILYLEHRRATDQQFSVRKLVEAISFSRANEGNPLAYREERDRDDARYDSGFALKNSTISNFLNRKASAMAEENLPLLRNFLVREGFLSPSLLKLGGRHPEPWLEPEFSGLAPTDARLQTFRYKLEGEYLRSEGDGVFSQLWIAAPGRSKPFVTLRVVTCCANEKTRPSLKCISLDGGAPPSSYEGRIFLMPGKTLVHIEVSSTKRSWDGRILRITPLDEGLAASEPHGGTFQFDRLSNERCAAANRSRYRVRDGVAASHGLSLEGVSGRLFLLGDGPSYEVEAAQMFYKKDRRSRIALNAMFIAAVKAGDLRAVAEALIQGADPNTREKKTGRTAAHLAAAANRLDIIRILTAEKTEEAAVIEEHLGGLALDEQALACWRRARLARIAAVKDSAEGCYPSAYAPVGFDDSERNRVATSIWRTLMRLEMEEPSDLPYRGNYAHLEYWQPSSVMSESMRLHKGNPYPP